ncbi:MAG: Flp pilus assembly complex ATPase component TadA [Deltaproteobacteria bacterium]|nr:Flp pilus assembly complex ATPase component TadA [Deltaproteobacteria bacterium]
MYQEHFNLRALPFEGTPDPAFFFLGPQYRETLAAMIHCVVSRKSLMVVSGPIGSGKTTLGRTLARYLPEKTNLVSIVHPLAAQGEMITFVAHQAGLKEIPEPRLFLIEALEKNLINLYEGGGRLLVVIDEAQLLSDENLEEIRLMSNLETDTAKLIQVILLGQPELIDTLNRPQVRQLRQRLAVIKILEAMDEAQTVNYIEHRLKVAGGQPEIFSPQARQLVARFSGGIPRIVNLLADTALLNAFAAGQETVEVKAVEEAAAELRLAPVQPGGPAQGPAPPPGSEIPREPSAGPEPGPEAEPEPTPEAEKESASDAETEPKPEAESQPDWSELKIVEDSETPPLAARSWVRGLVLLIIALAALGVSLWLYLSHPLSGS